MLENIRSPQDLKDLNLKELNELAREIRTKIVETVSKNGGHLAPSLGVVELTLAIHYVFDAPLDRIIWDVGHQAYAHKLVTGRYPKFSTLRQFKGISGFPKRSESPFDALDTGHSSTSISAGLGMSTGIALQQGNSKVVVVIGDGSMTAGLAFEGLNNAGHLKKDLIVILNDNEMSISPNVGALSSFLSRKLTGRFIRRFKGELESFLKKTEMGGNIWSVLKRSEESLKGLFTPGMLFEALQFDYIGPIPGHNLEALIETLKNVKDLDGPLLIHVITKKGKGYPPAERHPERFHGTGPFDPITGAPKVGPGPKPPSYTEVFSKALVELAREDQRICAITAAMPSGTGLKRFQEEIPQRFFDVGIAEQHAVTFAAGLALEGMRPVVAIYSTFLQRAYDQIIHDVCLTNLPVVFAVDRGGLVGDDGPTHHGAFDLAYLRAIPNMVIMTPKDEEELRHMLYTAICLERPVAVRYPRGRGLGVDLGKEFKKLEFGKAEILSEGGDATILACGNHVETAMKAAKRLSHDGIKVTVVNARFVKPVDVDTVLRACHTTGNILTIEENTIMGGFGSAIAEAILDHGLTNVKCRRLGIPDRFIEHGPQSTLRELIGLDVNSVARAVKELIGA